MADPPPQPEGFYMRLNAGLMKSGQYSNCIVSLVGKFEQPHVDGSQSFLCCDQDRVQLNMEQADVPGHLLGGDMVVEIVGQVLEDNNALMLFVTRELSTDMDLDVYNKMIQVQHNPKFQKYFVPTGLRTTNGVPSN